MPHLVTSVAIALSGLWLALAWPGAAEAACAPTKAAPKVTFKSVFPHQPVFYDSYTRAEIARFATIKLPLGKAFAGLTRGSYTHRMSAKGQYGRADNGYCVYLTEIDFTFEFKDLFIFVAKEYPRGSCRYNTTLAHEMQHVNLYKASFTRHAPALKATLEAAARSLPPLWVPSQQDGIRKAMERLEAILKPQVTAFWEEATRNNAAIDTEQSYRILDQQCPN